MPHVPPRTDAQTLQIQRPRVSKTLLQHSRQTIARFVLSILLDRRVRRVRHGRHFHVHSQRPFRGPPVWFIQSSRHHAVHFRLRVVQIAIELT